MHNNHDAALRPSGETTDRQTNFRALWIASSSGYLASWALQLALPLFAVQLSNSPLLVSGVMFALTAPWLFFSLYAGVLVDRIDRRQMLIIVSSIRVLTLALATLAALFNFINLVLIYIIALILGITETLAETAAGALLPMIVPSHQLEHANTRLAGAQMVIELLSMPLGGLFASIGVVMATGISGICYGLGLVAFIFLRGTFRPSLTVQQKVSTEIIEGVRYLWKNNLLWTIGIMAAIINGSWNAWLAVLALYAVAPGPMGMSPFGYSLLLMMGSVGGAIGTVLAVPVQRWLGRRWTIGINILGNAIMFASPALTTNIWLVGAASILGGIGGPMWMITMSSLKQRIVPIALQGRVSSAYRFLSYGGLALGPPIGGFIAQFFGIPVVFLICALLTALMMIPFLRVVSEAAMSDTIVGVNA